MENKSSSTLSKSALIAAFIFLAADLIPASFRLSALERTAKSKVICRG